MRRLEKAWPVLWEWLQSPPGTGFRVLPLQGGPWCQTDGRAGDGVQCA